MSDQTPTDEDSSRIAAWLADHPRVLGVLFTIATLAATAAPAVADEGTGVPGP